MRGSAGLMARLMQRAETAVQTRQRVTVERISGELEGLGVRAVSERDGIVLTGKGVLRRWLIDPALRFAARLGR